MASLESSIKAGRESLLSHGLAMAAIGDNIANVNTTGFKTSRVEFSSLLSEGADGKDSDATPDGVGAGVTVSSIRQIQELGAIEDTGRALDAAIDGAGFFVVGTTTDQLYSRAGDFSINSEGFLVNSQGLSVLGFSPTAPTTLAPVDILSVDIQATPSTEVSVVGNLDSQAEITTAPAAAPASFTALAQVASFTSNIDVVDSLGELHGITLAYFKTANNTWTAQAYIDSGEVGGTAGELTKLGANATLTFNNTGQIEDANQAAAALTLNPAYGNGAAAGNIALDLSEYTQQAGFSNVLVINGNGQQVSAIDSYEIRPNGDIVANLESGQNVVIATLAAASFPNIDAMEKVGNNLLRALPAAGTATVAAPDSEGIGSVRGAALERSTVDLAKQFTDMILVQRAYQGSAQAINAADGLIDRTLQLI